MGKNTDQLKKALEQMTNWRDNALRIAREREAQATKSNAENARLMAQLAAVENGAYMKLLDVLKIKDSVIRERNEEIDHMRVELVDTHNRWNRARDANEQQLENNKRQAHTIKEFQGTVSRLHAAARQAPQFEQLRADHEHGIAVRDTEIKGLRSMLKQYKADMDKAEDEAAKIIAQKNKRLELRDADLDNMQAKYAELASDNRALETAYNQACENVRAAISQRDAAEVEAARLRERLSNLIMELQTESVWRPRFLEKQEQLKELKNRVDIIEAQVADKTGAIEIWRKNYDQLAAKLKNCESALDSTKRSLNETHAKREQLQERVFEANEQINAFRKGLHDAARMIGMLEQ